MEIKVSFDNIRNIIIEHLQLAEEEIDIAVAWITDKQIVSVLHELLEKGVNINILFYDDHINDKNIFQKLYNDGAVIRCTKELMHNKFCIIDNYMVINGSYNWTNNASDNNYENIQIMIAENDVDQRVIVSYENEFYKLFELNKWSERYFKTTTELFDEYLLEYTPSYPCFKKIRNPDKIYSRHEPDFAYVFIPNKEILYQCFTIEQDEKKISYFNKDTFSIYINVYGEFDDKRMFMYFAPNANRITVESKKGVFQIDKTEQIVTGIIESQQITYLNVVSDASYRTGIIKYLNEIENPLGANKLCFVSKEDGHYLYMLKEFKCIDLPDFFYPKIAVCYDRFILLDENEPESRIKGLKALLDLSGNVIIEPHYSKIFINERNKTIECTEYPIWEKISINISLINYPRFPMVTKYIIKDSGVIEKENCEAKYLNNCIYMSEDKGFWAELYQYLRRYSTNAKSYRAFCKTKEEFRDKLTKFHNDKNNLEKFRQKWIDNEKSINAELEMKRKEDKILYPSPQRRKITIVNLCLYFLFLVIYRLTVFIGNFEII